MGVSPMAYELIWVFIMEAGIVGLPFIGKSSLFQALTSLITDSAASATKLNVGVVNVPDRRLTTLSQYIETKKIVPATLQVVDLVGLVSGASTGEGMGNKFLAHIRNVDAILHVVRCFEDPSIPHVNGSVDPLRDIEQVETELMLADLEVVENSIRNAQRKARTGEREAKLRLELMQRCSTQLSEGRALRHLLADLSDEEDRMLRSFAMLTAKPVLYVANVDEADSSGDGEHVNQVEQYAHQQGGKVVALCAKLEAELAELEETEREEMLEGLGLAEPALNVLARATYELLGLQCFFTIGPKEIRAWTVTVGARAPQAAGVIHSDFERGFIRVEVHTVADLEKYKTIAAIKAAGKLRVEGKEYVVKEGDACHFLFNV